MNQWKGIWVRQYVPSPAQLYINLDNLFIESKSLPKLFFDKYSGLILYRDDDLILILF
jgi:hypothetical protein